MGLRFEKRASDSKKGVQSLKKLPFAFLEGGSTSAPSSAESNWRRFIGSESVSKATCQQRILAWSINTFLYTFKERIVVFITGCSCLFVWMVFQCFLPVCLFDLFVGSFVSVP